MSSSKVFSPIKFILRLTLRLELYTALIVVPLVYYFGKLTGHYDAEASHVLRTASGLSIITCLIIGTIIRFILLSIIFRKINKESADLVKTKRRLLNYPRVEMAIIILRWALGLIYIYLTMYLHGYVDLARAKIYFIDIVMSSTVNGVIAFFATENILSRVLTLPRMIATPVPAGSYSQLSIPVRLLMTVIAVIIIPLVIMGLMIILIHSKTIELEQLGGHIIFITVMSIITLTVILLESTRGIRQGMRMTIDTLKTLEQGDFNVESIPMLDRSEIGTISQYVNWLSTSLREFFRKNIALNRQLNSLTVQLTRNAEALTQNTREEASSMEEIMATTEEISSGAESATNSVEDQFAAMESLIQSMSDLSTMMAGVTERIESVISLSGEIDATAGASATTLDAMIESLKIVSESSAQMTGIIEIINDISDKINLLSLNASIEAARAGEAGRGFAVVADEVSKLADMTANSIKDISSLVQRNIDEIRTGMKRIDDTVATISSITKLVNSINVQTTDISGQMKTQRAINEKVNRETDTIKQKSNIVKSAMQEQKNALSEIVKAIASINQSTQSTVEAADNLFRSAKEADKVAAELTKD